MTADHRHDLASAAATTKPPTSVELLVRSLGEPAVFEGECAFAERVDRLQAAGVVETGTVEVWGRRLVLSPSTAETEPGRRFLDRLARFREWAERTGASLEPHFTTTTATSRFTGEECTVVVLPVRTLAEYDGDEVVSVTPCTVDGTVRTVDDRLTALEATIDAGERADQPMNAETDSPDRSGASLDATTGDAVRQVLGQRQSKN